MNWWTILEDRKIPVHKKGRTRLGEDQVRVALRFLFREDNAHLLSWGYIRIRQDGHTLPIPRIYRRMSTEHLWSSGRGKGGHEEGEGSSLLGRTVLIGLMNTFTRPGRKIKNCVDYILEPIIYYNIRTLERFFFASIPRGKFEKHCSGN